jgi:PKD repeat protein
VGKTDFKKIFKVLLSLVLVFFVGNIFLNYSPVYSCDRAPKDDIKDAIALGISWLASRQNADGSWGYSGYKVALTGFVLIKLQEYAYEINKSPFDKNYVYKDNVINGWQFLLETDNNQNPLHLGKVQLCKQKHGEDLDDPDTNKNGFGIAFDIGSYVSYSTGICMMALKATGLPNRENDGGLDLDNDNSVDTYFELLQEAADWAAYAQGDLSDTEGGWGYYANNNSNYNADNSVSGYVVLGLAAAEDFGCKIPFWVKTKLNVFIQNIQDPVNDDYYDGGSWYRPNRTGDTNLLRTGNLIFEMTFYGDSIYSDRFIAALDNIERNWKIPGNYSGWGYGQDICVYQSMFCLMKGLEYSGISYLDLDNDSKGDHDWYNEFADVLIEQQNENGSWPRSYRSDDSLILSTSWALLTLEKTTPTAPLEHLPIAHAGGPYICDEFSCITFNASLSYDPDGDELEYRWDFQGNDTWDTDWSQKPTCEYIFGDDWIGTVIVGIRERNSTTGFIVKDDAAVIIKNVPPKVSVIDNISIYKNQTLKLSAMATDLGSDDIVFEWIWGYSSLNNNESIYYCDSNQPDPYPSPNINPRIVTDHVTCVFNETGYYKSVLVVRDDDGGVTLENISIIVNETKKPKNVTKPKNETIPELPNIPPIARLSSNVITGVAPLKVNFIGDAFDSDGVIVRLIWDFAEGMQRYEDLIKPLNATYDLPVHIYYYPGIYNVSFTVFDDDGAFDHDFITINVKAKTKPIENNFTVNGNIYKAKSTMKIAHAKISMNDEFNLSDYNGYYSFVVQRGVYSINVTKSGYQSISSSIHVNSNLTFDFYLKPIDIDVPEQKKAVQDNWSWVIIIIILIITTIIISILVNQMARHRKKRKI